VPPDFIQNSATTTPPAGAPGGDPFATAPAAGTSGGLTLRRLGAKEFLESRGVQFPEGASASFSSGTSTLVVRNTVPNIEVVESLVEQALKQTPKLVTVTVRMLEVGQNNLDELGFDWLLGGGGSNAKVDFAGGSHGNAVTPNNIARFPFTNITTSGVPLASAVTSVGLNPITSGLRTGDAATTTNRLDQLLSVGSTVGQVLRPAPGILSIAGVFTDPQFQAVMRGLNQKKGLDIVSSPSVTTKNGQKATVVLGREFIYPTEFDPPQVPQNVNTITIIQNGVVVYSGPTAQLIATPATPTAFEMLKLGVILEVEPVIGEDGSVELTLAPTITDFEGFVNYGSPIARGGPGGVAISENIITENRILQPIFKTSKTATSVRVWDGSTIMLGGLQRQEHSIVDDKVPILGDIPIAGRLFRSHSHSVETKNIIFFVTVDVIDPSGRKIRRDQTAAVAP
jgi:general secretion pathway protein D